MFSDSESENEDNHQLTINEHYAKAFQYKKEREELDKLKQKYGSDFEESDLEQSETDSESAESEDEDGEELTPAVDAAILRTLARIKRRDPEIYNSEKSIFNEEQTRVGAAEVPRKREKEKDKSKPITMRQMALENTLRADSRSPSPQPLTHVQEQRQLRDETIAAFHTAADEMGDEDDLLMLREKTKDELEEEEEEYQAFLEREVGGDIKELVSVDNTLDIRVDEEREPFNSKKKKKKKKSDAPTKPRTKEQREQEDQEFLMNYILNRGWIDRSANRVPTYKEVISHSKSKATKDAVDNDDRSENFAGTEVAEPEDDQLLPTADPDVDEDDFEEIVDRFESSYNFRFEEPDAATIKRYPRNMESTVRRVDSTRKDARQRRKERKEEELEKKKEEVRRMKALKMKAIRHKLEKIGREGGKDLLEDSALQDLDLEGDWDADAHDQQMQGLYGDDIGEEDPELKKPTWDDDIDIDDIIGSSNPRAAETSSSKPAKKKKKKKAHEPQSEDGVDIDAMDADVERPPSDDEEWDGTEEMRKRKLDEYMEEIYGLEFNDLVGDLPTRFKYVPVMPESFALSSSEILSATDAELNEYMGIKKYAPYRPTPKSWDVKRRDRLQDLRKKISDRTGTSAETQHFGDSEGKKKKRKGKKERLRSKGEIETHAEDDTEHGQTLSKPPKRKRSASEHEDDRREDTGAEEDPQVDGDKPKRKKRRRHKKSGVDTGE